MSTFGNNKFQRQSTSHLSPRAGCKNAKNSPFAPSSPPSSSSSQSSSPPRRRDAIKNVIVNAIRKTARSTPTTVLRFRGVRYREELNKYVSEIRPTRCAKKIWLGTYDTAEEAARAFDIGNLCCNKKLPLNFEDSPAMLQRLERISSQLSPEEVRSAIAKHAKECARLHMSVANLPKTSSLGVGEVLVTPEPKFSFQSAMAQSGQFCNQFDARSVFVSFEQSQAQYGQVQQACLPQQFHFDSKVNHNHAAGTRSDIFLEQLAEQVCEVMEVATAVPMTMRGGDGSRSWEFDVYSKIPSDASLPDPDIAGIPALSDGPLDAIDNHMFEDHMFQASGSGDHMFDDLFQNHNGL